NRSQCGDQPACLHRRARACAEAEVRERQGRGQAGGRREEGRRGRTRAAGLAACPSRVMRLLVVAATGLALLAGTARAAGPPVLGFSVSSAPQGSPSVSLPTARTPNVPG